MLKLLFIEDERQVVQPVIRLIENQENDVCCEISDFATAEGKIASFLPDIVILDLLLGGSSPEEGAPEGLNTREFIWNKHFCPIVIHSAKREIYDNKCRPHPFVKSIQKGRNSPQQILDAISEFLPHVESLKEAENNVRHSLSRAMRDVAPYAFDVLDDATQRNDMIKRSGRRRLAAQMDEISRDRTKLAGWDQYLHPPICEDIRLGDILKQKSRANAKPASFRVVLTPSCDLVSSGSRQPKVSHVLVARCLSIKDGLQLTSWKDIGIGKLTNRLAGTLTQGYLENIIFFPSLKKRIPTMAANLKDLELIPIKEISNPHGKFLRMASLDSPFRELVAWAYLETAGRPGLPDRDTDLWSAEIIKAYQNNSRGKNT